MILWNMIADPIIAIGVRYLDNIDPYYCNQKTHDFVLHVFTSDIKST